MSALLLVDGHCLLFQMFFGMPARIVNADGKAIQGTLGFVGALLRMIRMVSPARLAVLFDGEHENARAALDPAYKANRVCDSDAPEEENPYSQLADIYMALDYLEIRHTEIAEYETDDVIAGYALRYGADMQIVIASLDSDFFQLVTDNVSMLRYRGKNTAFCDKAYIRGRYGVEPAQYADFKCLTGDPSDNIRGAFRVGPKTAAQLLNEFGTLDKVIACADGIRKPSVRRSVADSAGRLRLNQRLIRLDDRAPLPFALDELAYRYGGATTYEVLRGIGLR